MLRTVGTVTSRTAACHPILRLPFWKLSLAHALLGHVVHLQTELSAANVACYAGALNAPCPGSQVYAGTGFFNEDFHASDLTRRSEAPRFFEFPLLDARN